MTDPRTNLKTKMETYLDDLTDENGNKAKVRHSFSDGQEPLKQLFGTDKEDLLVVYRRGSGRHPHHAASGIYAYTYTVEVGLACIDKGTRIHAQVLLNSAIEEIEEVVRERSFGDSYVTSESIRFENVPVGGNQLMFTAWLTVPVREYVV